MDLKHGKDEELEKLADRLLNQGAGKNKRSTERDIEKMSYEAGFISRDELQCYEPVNDWDTHDSAFAIFMDPEVIESGLPDRKRLTRHVEDSDDWGSTKEDMPLLGVNEGPRKTCTRCKKSKGLTLFSPKSDAKDRLHPWCKECRKNTVSQKRNNSRSEG